MAESRRQMLEIEAVDPGDGKKLSVFIAYDRLQAIGKRSFGQGLEIAHVLPQALAKPTAVFEGLRWETDEDRKRGVGWRCYVCIPDCSYTQEGKKQPPWQDEVFLAFVNAERVVYNWRWESADKNDGRLPVMESSDGKSRFQRRLL